MAKIEGASNRDIEQVLEIKNGKIVGKWSRKECYDRTWIMMANGKQFIFERKIGDPAELWSYRPYNPDEE
jgi:hypothetical protein